MLNTLGNSSALVGDCTVFYPALTIGEAELEQGAAALAEELERLAPRWI